MSIHDTEYVAPRVGGSAPVGADELTLYVGDRSVGGDELESLIAERQAELGGQRSLVVLEGGNDLDFVVTYLAARAGGHPLVLAGSGSAEALIDRYDPDVVVTTDRSGAHIERRHPLSIHDLHPDLAVLMSTSGSTGSPKLVRLSASNLDANARAIAEFQGLTADDCGITSLPLHYCYGLSVLNAHRAVGGSLVLTDLSVVDPCFWDAMARHGVSNLAGVPHTFELIARAGNEHLQLERLRLVTQAGGRMEPHRVRELAELGQRYGWDLIVMYGQTEATARMAYLPPALARRHPDRVGVAIPGGSIEIADVDDDTLPPGTGEVVYRGPNVMMGYAEAPADLSRGAEHDELRTGDLGRIDANGLLELVGRSNRFAKLFGLRIDLARLERQLADRNLVAACASDDSRLVVAIEVGDHSRRHLALVDLVAGLTSLPARSVDVIEVDRLPRLASGKIDAPAILRAAPSSPPPTTDAADVAAIYSDVLGVRSPRPSDTFASLGGDSFSYVEVSIRLEALLGRLPADWHLQTISALSAIDVVPRRRWLARVETSVLLRAFAIVAVVTTHMHITRIPGGAHMLLAVVGFNFARFVAPRLVDTDLGGVLRKGLAPVGRIAAVTSAWVAVQMLVWGGYGWTSLLLVNNYLGGPRHVEGRWRYWFFEAMVVILLVVVALFCVARVRSFARRHPFAFPMALLVPASVLRFEIVRLVDRDFNYVYRPDTIVWCFLLGWAAATAATWRQRAVVSVAGGALAYGYFDYLDREIRVILAVAALAWVPVVIVPRLMARPLGWVASASMWIFMTHWVIWPELTPLMPDVAALVGTIAGGTALWGAWRFASGRWRAAQRHTELVP